jgi:hypothetical protein
MEVLHKRATIQDQIESRYSEQEIRQFYAKLAAGRGKYTRLQDIPSAHLRYALGKDIENQYLQAYEPMIEALVRDWYTFRKKDAHF